MNNIVHRLTSIIFYTLPLKASLPFGYYLFQKFSFLKVLFYITFPVAFIESSLPFGSLLFFLAVAKCNFGDDGTGGTGNPDLYPEYLERMGIEQ